MQSNFLIAQNLANTGLPFFIRIPKQNQPKREHGIKKKVRAMKSTTAYQGEQFVKRSNGTGNRRFRFSVRRTLIGWLAFALLLVPFVQNGSQWLACLLVGWLLIRFAWNLFRVLLSAALCIAMILLLYALF